MGYGKILQYFEHRTTRGVVEGINNCLTLIKRSRYGFRHFERFRLRCLIANIFLLWLHNRSSRARKFSLLVSFLLRF